MPTILTLFSAVMRKLTPAEVDANFTALRTTADGALGGRAISETPTASQIPAKNAGNNLVIPTGRVILGGGADDTRNVHQVAGRVANSGGEIVPSMLLQIGGTSKIRRNRDLFSIYNHNGSVSGTVKIVIPNLPSASMNLTIEGLHMVSPTKRYSVRLALYSPAAAGPSWQSASASIEGDAPFTDVRLVTDGANTCILLGNTATLWGYPQIVLSADTGYAGWTLDSSSGWAASFITDETGLTVLKNLGAISNLYPSLGPISPKQGIQFPPTQVASTDPNNMDDYREASYTTTATGMTTSPTGVIAFVRAGNMVTMEIPTITGISNAITFTLTGGPTTMRPSASRSVFVRVTDNGGSSVLGVATIETSGVITIYAGLTGVFTASGTKAITKISVSYIL